MGIAASTPGPATAPAGGHAPAARGKTHSLGLKQESGEREASPPHIDSGLVSGSSHI